MNEIDPVLLEDVHAFVAEHYRNNIDSKYVFHNFQHTHDVYQAVNELTAGADIPYHDIQLLKLAALFHDMGYDQGPGGHEERSAAYARAFLQEKSMPENDIQVIENCIHATRMGMPPRTLYEKILCDADLAHLGTKIYWERTGKIRQEMALAQNKIMSDDEWIRFELDFMLAHRYYTDQARELYENDKSKHIRLLKKQLLRLNPSTMDLLDELELMEFKESESQKKWEKKLKKLNEPELGRGVETMYRATYRTHVNLSSIADNKANFMLSINAIILSVVVSALAPRISATPLLIIPTVMLMASCLTALVFAILATRPKVTEGKFTREDIESKQANLLFFGNFYNMKIEDFHWGMMEMIRDADFLYSSMTRDLYYLGVVLAKKYKYLRFSYSIFMFGIILSVLAFAIVFTIS